MDTPTPLVPGHTVPASVTIPAPQPQTGFHPDPTSQEAAVRLADRRRDNLDRENSDLDGLSDQLKNVHQLLERLQNTPGRLNSEDQLLLDSVQAAVSDAISKFQAIASSPRLSRQVVG